jgi:hypothetical protein
MFKALFLLPKNYRIMYNTGGSKLVNLERSRVLKLLERSRTF